MSKTYDVAAYVWPSYTGDEPRARMFWPEGIGEWETVLRASSKFPGHSWPRRPLWGCVNEADPRVMEMQIDAAADHGVNVFIYDWYWYDRRPFLEQCLNNGYLAARNNHRMKFYLMWANHDVNDLWDIRLSGTLEDNILWDAGVDRNEFERISIRMMNRYFVHPSYYKIEGKPVLMIYDLQKLIQGLGGEEEAREALEWFRHAAKDAGFPGLHLQLSLRENSTDISGVAGGNHGTPKDVIERMGFDSLTHYQFIHFTDIDRDYNAIVADAVREWERLGTSFTLPYFPHVSVGWDNNPRYKMIRPGVVKNNSPENVRRALEQAKSYVDAHPGQPPLITVNSWNEWTETSYLQPDNLYGYGYLEAVKEVFGYD